MSLFRPIPATGKMPAVAVFDLDKTLIAGDSTVDWTDFLYEKGVVTDPVYREVNRRMMKSYRAGTLDIAQYLREAVPAYAGLDRAARAALLREFVDEKIAPVVYKEGLARVNEAKSEGMAVFIISASNTFFVEPIGRELFGVEHSLGVDLVEKDGFLTPEIIGIPTFQDGKVKRLEAELVKIGRTMEETVFFTDSRNDLPLALAAGDCEVVNPDHALREAALRNRWRANSWFVG